MDIRQPGFTRFSRQGKNLGRLHVLEATHSNGLDGTDELTIMCKEDVDKNDYVVWRDRQGVWHEHIVDRTARAHDDSGAPLTVATCINSINETWDDYIEDKRPSGTVQVALASVVNGTRWSAGLCTQQGTNSHTFYHISVREALQELLEVWGGELETRIACNGSMVTAREVRILALRGNQNSAKRFTWSKDLVSINRDVLSDNPKSRLYAYGKGEETETGGYGRRIGIESVNDGLPYVEDVDATRAWGHPTLDGNIAPSCGVYLNENCEDPAQLLEEARAALEVAKYPQVTYTAEVLDLVSFGRDWEDVSLGDLVTIIDKGFSDDGIRLKGRVSKIERDLYTYETTVTFGTLYDALTAPFQSLQTKLASLSNRAVNWDLAGEASLDWLETLITNLNAAYAQAGTYHYSSFEKGEIWSNVPLDANGNPTRSGGWAMNINGHGFRLASGTKSDGSWNWRTFGNGEGFTADEINVGELNASLMTAGILSGPNFTLNLDNGVTVIGNGTTVGDRSVAQLLEDVDATITNVDVEYAQSQSDSTPPESGWSTTAPTYRSGYYIWQRTATTNADGTTYSTPVMVSGKDGTNGDDGTGIVSIVEQYYLSTSDSTQTGGSWSANQPEWVSGKYIWTRSLITWDTTPTTTTTTTPVLAKALNSANKKAEQTATLVREYNDGVLVCKRNQYVGALMDANGGFRIVGVSWSNGVPTAGTSYAILGAHNPATVTHVQGEGTTIVNPKTAFTIGTRKSTAEEDIGNYSFALGTNVTASGAYSYAEGYNSTASGAYSHAEGANTISSKSHSHAEGMQCEANADWSHAEGWSCKTIDDSSTSGLTCYASHAEGKATTARGVGSHAEGTDTTANNSSAHAEGSSTTASGGASHAEGTNCVASGGCSHAEGRGNTASGDWSHVEGGGGSIREGNTASGRWSHAEGWNTEASNDATHAEGHATTASASCAHAEGSNTKATGINSHAEGTGTTASGQNSHASGNGTTASGNNQTVCGTNNATNSNALFIVGNGNATGSNAFYVLKNGNATLAGTLTQSSDRRLKEHISYLGNDACEFVRALKPALYMKDEARHLGFYAQDVQEAEPSGWDTETVSVAAMSEAMPDMLQLDYTALIAPLVTYCQQLEARIIELEQR